LAILAKAVFMLQSKQSARRASASRSNNKETAQLAAQVQQPQTAQLQAASHAELSPLTPAQLMHMQKTGGNRAAVQLMQSRMQAEQAKTPIQRKENNTGMPDGLKSGIESLSGIDMSDVKVHYNSDKPSQLNALAYAQSSDIYVGPGQEKHLPHESWHVAQQKSGRVQATAQVGGVAINDSPALEREADVMGARALQMKADPAAAPAEIEAAPAPVAQMKDEYYPSGDKEPHIHIHHGGITFTGVGHAHKALQRGDQIRENVIMEAYQDLQALDTDRARLVIAWMQEKFGIDPPVASEEELTTGDENLPDDWVESETADHNPEGTPPVGFSFGAYTSKLK
jgi:hypothetical protein